MYCASRFRRIVVHSCVVLAFCLYVVTCGVTPVDSVITVTQNGKHDTNSNPKSVKKVLKEAGNEPAAGVVKTNISDNLSNDPSQKQTSEAVVTAEDNKNEIPSNFTSGSPTWLNSIKSGALERAGFVALGIMSILLFFFIIRAIRIRRKKSKSRKYGVITSTASDMEMEPLDRGEDDEEETTLFDAQHKYSLK